MGLTNALFTGLTGISAGSQAIEVAGNNISNVNTTAFKSSRITFETQITQTLAGGSAPSGDIGGVNPAQIGLGTRVGSVARDFSNGAISPTGVNTDLAIEGDGFFIVNDAGTQRFTRNGNFSIDSDFQLTTASGGLVQGFGINEDFEVVEGVLTDLTIPTGVTTIASATSQVTFAGNLNAGGTTATQGSITSFETLFTDAAATVPATGASALAGLFISDGAGGSTAPFALGDVITISGATRGGSTIPDRTFEINAAPTPGVDADANGTTLQDFADFLDNIFGIDASVAPAGVTVTAGVLNITGNIGSSNNIVFDDTNLVVNAGVAPASPLTLTQTQDADGESTLTTFTAFDSLGNPLTINLTTTLISQDANGTVWEFRATSEDESDLDTFLGTGQATFNSEGQFTSLTDSILNLDRTGTGADNPLAVELRFTDPFGSVTSLVDQESSLNSLSQDGFPIGTLADFSVDRDGTITGTFTNGLRQTLGRIPIATFANPNGLVEVGGSLFEAENNSGNPAIVTAGTGGSGTVVASALELSNVELSEEFVNLITASTGFSASSRVITTSDELIQELLQLVR